MVDNAVPENERGYEELRIDCGSTCFSKVGSVETAHDVYVDSIHNVALLSVSFASMVVMR